MRSKNRADHWQKHARQWARIASPLRPLPEDVELFRRLLGHDVGNYLLLGVTPELVALGKQSVAVDLNEGMIGAVWPGFQPHRHVVQGSWLGLPFTPAVFDGAVGDGSLSNLLYPQQYEQLWGELSRVLRPRGTAVLRVFATPESGESMHSVLSAAMKGKIKSFHAFKWRFAMAMVAKQDTPNIAVASIYQAFERHFPDRAALSHASGWSLEEIATIDVYRNSQAVYSFPTVSELRHIWGGYFRETGMAHGTYELADRCPVIGLKKIVMRGSTSLFHAMHSGGTKPGWPPLVNLLCELERSEWLPSSQIIKNQHAQLVVLARHAALFSPHFQERLQIAGLRPEDLATPEGLRRLPLLSRRDLQSAGDRLFCTQMSQEHAPIIETQTSGSSGEPVVVWRTAVTKLFWMAFTMREHFWQARDFRCKLASIRANLPQETVAQEDWGLPASRLLATGPAYAMSIATDVERQVSWLKEICPDYLLTYPNNLAELLRVFERQGVRLTGLRQIRTIGETLSPGLRDETKRVLGVDIADVYSSQEVGVIAQQCPNSGLYHIMAEGLIVEVLDDKDEPCRPGQVGRAVVTDLHNFATPLVRYVIGDYAEAGSDCPCGRGLPVIRRIMGRSRNMVMLPDGRRHWPLVGFHRFREIASIRQYQLVQRTIEVIEVRLVTDHAPTTEQEMQLTEVIQTALCHPFKLDFKYFNGELPRGPGGKFEEFISQVIT